MEAHLFPSFTHSRNRVRAPDNWARLYQGFYLRVSGNPAAMNTALSQTAANA